MAFVQKIHDYARKNPDLVPPYLDLEEMSRDLAAIRQLREFQMDLGPLASAVDDNMILAGSDAYRAALLFLNSTKLAAKSNIGCAHSIYQDLSTRFPGRPAARKSAAGSQN